MKHFIVEIIYKAPAESISEVVGQHRAFLQQGYDSGMLLCSGPQNPKTGGIVVARAASKEALEEFFAQDPYQNCKLADYRYIEFAPVKFQGFLESWVSLNPVTA